MITKEITSLQHPFIKHLVKLRNDRKYRNQERQVVVAGKKLVHELSPVKILLTEKGVTPLPSAEEIIYVNSAILKKITGLENPEEVAAVVALPPEKELNGKRYLLALDNLSDPGNVGTLLRTALALGWEGAFLLEGCADPFNDKAIRAAKGATFRLPLQTGNWECLQQLIADNQMRAFIADAQGTPIDQIQAKPPLLLILGNEAHGVSAQAKKLFPSLSIPIEKEMESLNVAIAGALLMYGLK